MNPVLENCGDSAFICSALLTDSAGRRAVIVLGYQLRTRPRSAVTKWAGLMSTAPANRVIRGWDKAIAGAEHDERAGIDLPAP